MPIVIGTIPLIERDEGTQAREVEEDAFVYLPPPGTPPPDYDFSEVAFQDHRSLGHAGTESEDWQPKFPYFHRTSDNLS